MPLKPIRNEGEYEQALARIDEIWDSAAGSPEADELEIMTILVAAYEDEVHPISPPDPIDALRFVMDQRGLRPRDLEALIGPSGRVSEVLRKQRPLTLPMIRRIHRELGVEPAVLIREYRAVKTRSRRQGPKRKAGRLAPSRSRRPSPRA